MIRPVWVNKSACAIAILWPGALYAHGFGSAEGYAQTLESMLESVYAPVILLLLSAFAVMAGTSGNQRSKHLLIAFAVGSLAGFPAASTLGPLGATACLIVGMLCALYAAAGLDLPRVMHLTLGFVAGAAVSIHNLDGHPLASLSFATHLGVFLGPMLAAAALTGWIGMILQAAPQPLVRIIFRIFASWSFAANAIFTAVQFKSGL